VDPVQDYRRTFPVERKKTLGDRDALGPVRSATCLRPTFQWAGDAITHDSDVGSRQMAGLKYFIKIVHPHDRVVITLFSFDMAV
jgi:hypothetical protein